MNETNRRQWMKGAGAVAAAGLLLKPRPARALIGVSIDPTGPALLAETIAQGITMLSQLAQMVQVVQNGLTLLKSLNPASMLGLASALAAQELGLTDLMRDINSIGYSLNQVNSAFNSVFPGSNIVPTMSYRDFQSASNRWNQELLGVSQVAMRAQSNLTKLQANADAASEIISNSAANDGEVAQAQANVQMTHLLSEQINQLIETTDTAGRVNATMAAQAASEEAIGEEQATRAMDGYTNRGAPVVPLRDLP